MPLQNMAFARASVPGETKRTITVASAGPSHTIPTGKPKAVKRASRKPKNSERAKVQAKGKAREEMAAQAAEDAEEEAKDESAPMDDVLPFSK